MADLAESILELDRRIRFVAIFDQQTRETLGIDRRKAEKFSLGGPQLRRLSRIIGKTRGYGPNTRRKYLSFAIEDTFVMLTVDESCADEAITEIKDYISQKVKEMQIRDVKVKEPVVVSDPPIKVPRNRQHPTPQQ